MKRIRGARAPENESPAEYRERFMAAVQEGLADAEAGRLLEDEEVTRLLDERFGPLKKTRQRKPRPT